MRGEHFPGSSEKNVCTGSSPHARGAQGISRQRAQHGGIIPACAGSTSDSRRCSLAGRDHPRMRGEHRRHAILAPLVLGSSPHARGARTLSSCKVSCEGIIPACAGSTHTTRVKPSHHWDHPRMRGEHQSQYYRICGSVGSSPHARGAHRRVRAVARGQGIIPACAGSTVAGNLLLGRAEDHPRMRGEHSPIACTSAVPTGSSPHARGALRGAAGVGRRGGIIPACAGSTSLLAAHRRRMGDHPRMRGEHSVASFRWSSAEGSSPHARGALHRRLRAYKHHGIIPACAGSTFVGGLQLETARDHPRMRGEHLSAWQTLRPLRGSSPHARGAPYYLSSAFATSGIIPACAGSTMTSKSAATAMWDHPRMRGEHTSRPARLVAILA